MCSIEIFNNSEEMLLSPPAALGPSKHSVSQTPAVLGLPYPRTPMPIEGPLHPKAAASRPGRHGVGGILAVGGDGSSPGLWGERGQGSFSDTFGQRGEAEQAGIKVPQWVPRSVIYRPSAAASP